MSQKGFSFVETLISLMLLFMALLFVGRMNMTSVNLIGKGKINQRATLLLLQKIEDLRLTTIQNLAPGTYSNPVGSFSIEWRIQDNTPYFGTKQIHCRVIYTAAASVIAESIFYRSE